MDYVRSYDRWTGDIPVERPADEDTIRYYFRVSGTDRIELYKDHQERVETEEDRRRKEEEEKSNRKEAELDEITERHFSLRLEFISEYGKAKKHIQEICRYAAAAIVGDGSWRRNEVDVDVLETLLDLDIDEDTDYETIQKMLLQKELENPEYVLLACAYASEDDEDNGYFGREWNSRKRAYDFSYRANDGLDRLYDFLISLGYEMSDEEKEMQNATHPLLCCDDTEADPCAPCKSAHPGCDKCCNACNDHCNAWQDCRRQE